MMNEDNTNQKEDEFLSGNEFENNLKGSHYFEE